MSPVTAQGLSTCTGYIAHNAGTVHVRTITYELYIFVGLF